MAAADTQKVGGLCQRFAVGRYDKVTLLDAGFLTGSASHDLHAEKSSLAFFCRVVNVLQLNA